MSRPRVLAVSGILLIAAFWLTVVTEAGAGPAPAMADTRSPIPPTSPVPSGVAPGPPGDLRATAVTSTSITLTWTASTPGCCPVEGYDFTYAQAFNDVFSTQAVGNVTTYTFGSAIRPATQYTFRVAARDELGHRSALSNPVTVITPLTDSGPDTTPPSAPGDLVTTGVSPAGVGLAWSGSTDDVGVTGYQIYRFDGVFISTLVATATGTSATVPLPTSSMDRWYVRARDAAGNLSIASNLASGSGFPTSPAPPSSSASSQPPPAACRVSYTSRSQWTGGFVADITVTNTAPAPVSGWAVTFRFGGDQRIISAWNAGFTQTGTTVTLTNLPWNRVIPPGGSASIGIIGRWTGDNPAPGAFAVNGNPCAAG